jgi:hypothetical protein
VALLERPNETDTYYGFAVSPDGKRVVTGVVVREVPSGKLVRALKPNHGRTVNGGAISLDGKTVATVSALQVLLFDAVGDRPARALKLEGATAGGRWRFTPAASGWRWASGTGWRCSTWRRAGWCGGGPGTGATSTRRRSRPTAGG